MRRSQRNRQKMRRQVESAAEASARLAAGRNGLGPVDRDMTRFVSNVVVLAFLMVAGSACGAGDPGGGVSGSLAQVTETGDSGASAMAESELESASEPSSASVPKTSVPEFQSEEESESPSDLSDSVTASEAEPEQMNERQAIQLTNNGYNDGYALWSPDGSRIAFLSDGDGDYNFDLATIMNADGTNVQQIIGNLLGEVNHYYPYISWSPDSSRILLFPRHRDSDFLEWNSEIVVVKADSLAFTRLADSDIFGGGASWSPDGTRILFQSVYPIEYEEAYEDSELFVMDADGSNVRQLTDNDIYDGGASWSPDGTQILFQRGSPFEYEEAYEDSELFVMDADGSNVRQLTDNDIYDGGASWSPDGTQILFRTAPTEFEGDYGGAGTYIIEANGSVTNYTHFGWNYSWSPDGSQILYSSPIYLDEFGVFVENIDGSSWQLLMAVEEARVVPLGWSPDGSRVLIVSNIDGDEELFVVNIDGSDLRQLTDNDSYDGDASWSPDGSRILFRSYRDGDSEIFVMDAP